MIKNCIYVCENVCQIWSRVIFASRVALKNLKNSDFLDNAHDCINNINYIANCRHTNNLNTNFALTIGLDNYIFRLFYLFIYSIIFTALKQKKTVCVNCITINRLELLMLYQLNGSALISKKKTNTQCGKLLNDGVSVSEN